MPHKPEGCLYWTGMVARNILDRIWVFFLPKFEDIVVFHSWQHCENLWTTAISASASTAHPVTTEAWSHRVAVTRPAHFFKLAPARSLNCLNLFPHEKNLRHAIASQAALALLQPRQHISVGARSSLPLHFHQGYVIPEYNWPIRGGISLLLANSVFSKEDETKKLIRCMTSNSVYELAFPSVPSLHAPPGTVQLL